jgi:hypothetical protein
VRISQALNSRSIARSLVTVLALTLIQTVVPTIVIPEIVTPKAEAVEVAYANATGGTDVVVPAGVYSITLTARGGAGGTGGNDSARLGLGSSVVGYAAGTFAVTPGDRITIYPGGAGGNGSTQVSGTGGGTPGAASIPTNSNTVTPSSKINGIWVNMLIANGGAGGPAGSGGSSGAGGGGGAASIVLINDNVAMVAAGGGGGAGGSGPEAQPWGGTYTSSNSARGAAGINGGTCGSTDGGGPGGGGGGWQGGASGILDRPNGVGECRAFGGSRGDNFVASNASSATNSYISPNGAGFITYDFIYSPTSACVTNSQTVDIYTVVRVTSTENCTWSVPATVSTIDLFLVGGGGGGAGDGGPGGNGGFALSRTAISVNPSSTMTLKVGYGGAASNWGWTSNAYAGDSTTVLTSTGTLYSARGGATGSNGPSDAAPTPATAPNGSFAGGKGGDGAGCFNVGTAGKRGISNYFYGSLNTYGGGGGAGACPNGAATVAALGADGGGAGGRAISGTENQVGSNGTAATGGGGGGGIATGSGIKLPGGKGGSGVILIRYATNSADAFPVSLSSALNQRWMAGDIQILDSTREGFIDSTGNFGSTREINGTVTIDTATTGNGSTKSFLQLKGDTGAYFNLENLPTNYTLFSIAKYQANSVGRIVTSSDQTWISGFWAGNTGVAYHSNWLTDAGYGRNDVWALSTDQLYSYRFNGVTRSNRNDSAMTVGNTLGINNSRSEVSSWQLGEVLVFNRELNLSEVALVETYLSRLYGISLSANDYSSETDTAGVFAGSTFLWAKGAPQLNLSDTFTIEAWVRPSSTCDSTHVCYIYAQENALVWGIQSGILHYALYGTGTAWVWTSTGIKVQSGEWHHLAISKELVGNRSNSLKFYLDGRLVFTKAGSPYTNSTTAPTVSDSNVVNPSNNRVHIGYRDSGWYYYGSIDEVKVWRGFRTEADIQSDMHSRSGTDSELLRLYLDFNKTGSSSTTEALNQATLSNPAFGMLPYGNIQYSDVKITATSGPYTSLTFPRTYMTKSGGWKPPTGKTTFTTLVVGGGGAGGRGDTIAYESGGGGAGGVLQTNVSVDSNTFYPIVIGTGGIGVGDTPTSGTNTSAFSLIAFGGGFGGFASGSGGSGGSGGGGTHNRSAGGAGTTGQGTAGETALSASSGGGGGGATTSGSAGVGGTGLSSGISGTTVVYGDGGGAGWNNSSGGKVGGSGNGGTGSATINVSPTNGNGRANTGSGGGGAYGSSLTVKGGNGGAGVVIVRFITASSPTYTAPRNAFLNAGMTETYTTNVAQDSATAMLTRTFRWESSTTGANGVFSTIKQGTGASNAFFSRIAPDTSTSGSQFVYRVIVTDSDTTGLFIQDTSTPVFAVINEALSMTGINTIKKTINVARSDTYTVFAGTSTYQYSLSPIIPGITLDSTTAMSPVLRISDTATVGTYLETITVTDSVSATFSIPLTITISAPPSLTAGGEVVKNGQVLNLDASNRWGVLGVDGVATNSLPWNDMSGNKKNAITSNATSTDTVGTLCKAPTFSNDFGGHFTFNGTDTCYYTPYLGSQFTSAYTIEAWIRPSSGTIPNGTQILSQMYNTAGEQISLTIGDLDQNTGKIYVGFFSGNGWRFANFPITPIANTWMHITGTYDGTTLRTFLNGALLGSATYSLYGTLNTKGYFIGKRWDSTYFYTGSIAEVRAYNVSLSDSQVALNYNATKYRYESSNQTILKPTQKYGALNIETFTVTSGGDTKTVTFAIGNRTGIAWDTTSIPGQIKLSVQESLTPGTYSDTITVTDNFGSATTLPIRFTVTKADTITVTAGAATTQVFNNQQATSLPAFGISGLVSSDTATFTQKYTGIDWTKPCSQGGGCEVGDTGPGGGTIFYISPTAINSASGISTGGRYLEVAPINWSGLSVESTTAWARAATSVTGTLSAIGAGAENTRLINNALTTNSVAAKVAADLTFGTKSDWFLPSTLELKEMYDALYAPSLAGNLSIRNYWSSTQDPTLSSRADTYWFGSGGLVSSTDKLGSAITLRPIRAYSPDTITVTTVPTFVDSYTVSVDTITMTSGLLSNYQAVVFQRSGLDITQARQDSLQVNTYGATLGLPFTVTILGGSGSGARTQTVAAGSTATGCAISGDTMTSTSAGACNLQIKKAYSRNYLTETTTATVFFLLWVINQPAPGVGSGPNIALSGENDVTVDIDLAPMISSLSTYAATAGVTSILINGVGFNGSDPLFELKFWRGIAGTGYTINPAKTQITVTVPAGARTGKVTVTTSKGLAVSEFALVVTP